MVVIKASSVIDFKVGTASKCFFLTWRQNQRGGLKIKIREFW